MSEKREIKTTLAIDGEKQFKAAMDEAYRGLKILGSEMKLNTAIFGDNGESLEGLAKKGEILSKQIAQQKEIITSLSQAVKDSADAYGESDKKTDQYRIKLNNAEAALARMEGELEDNEEAIKGYGKETDNADKKTSKWRESLVKVGDTLGKTVVAGAKAAAVAVGAMAVAAGAAAVKLGKEVVKSFADYEQLVGGVDTLFKDSSRLVQEYANNAYKTAGLSANAYMETVTGFSASLIQSLGGDTEKAARIADMAITDMSDNANKMGTDMSSLQSAYQGFAKQNYTMLDNLKLGYGGTKTEMERLLADASKIAGVKFDISSYSDVIQAINVMQQSMGIAGTTALEATETISGSMNSTKAAVHNLITGLGVAGADVGALVGNVVESFGHLVKNITPVIETMITALPVMITGIMEAVSGMLPTIIETVTGLFAQVMTMLVSLLPQLTPVAVDAILTIVRALIDNLPMILTAASQVVTGLVDGIQAALPQLIPAAMAGITTFVSGIISVLPKIIKAGVEMLTSLLDGITKSIPQLIPAAVDGVMTVVDTIIDNLPQVIDSGIKMVVALIKGIIDSLPKIIAAMPQLVQSLVKGIMDNIENIIMSGVDLVLALIDGIIKSLPEIVKAMPQIIGTMVTALVQGIPKLFNVGVQMIQGIWEGIKSMATWFWEQLKQWFSDALGWIGKLLGIKSPSRVMAEQIGKPMAQGVAVGITQNAGLVDKAMESLVPDTSGMLNAVGNFGRMQSAGGSFVMTLDDSSLDRLADKIAAVMQREDTTIVLNDREFGRAVRRVAMA